VKADASVALEFLRLLYPEGPWVLVAIQPDAGNVGTIADTFRPASADALVAWVTEHNKARNVYYHVNRPMGLMAKKASREDIGWIHYLHVDADPRVKDPDDTRTAAEWFAAEQDRIIQKLAECPGGIPAPTAIVNSGGGINALWKLDTEISIDGSIEAAEHFKRYNLQLEHVYGGDDCHNVDRILRLPGTVNWPNEKKRKKGREPVMSRLVSFDAELVYPLTKFIAAPLVQSPIEAAKEALHGGSLPRVQISGNIRRLGDAQALASICRPNSIVPPGLVSVVANGYDPNNPSRFSGDRSRAVFYVCCELLRLGASDDDIYGVITDPDLGISAHVLDKGGASGRTAERQIARAKDHAVDPWMAELNNKHAIVGNYGGQCVVIEEIVDPSGRGASRLSAQSFENFAKRYQRHKIAIDVPDKKGGTSKKEVKLGDWWLNHRNSLFYERVVFSPGREMPGCYNLWQGFAVDAVPGDAHLPWLTHVRDVICSGDPVTFRYVWAWLARAVQRPAEAGQVAITLRGGQGVGKGTFVKWFGALWGRHYQQISDSKHLTGNFNAHLAGVCVLFADEAFYAGDPRNADILKRLITEETISIERKHVDLESTPNYLHLIIASNHEWVVRMDLDDRRYLFLDVDESKKGDRPYWNSIDESMRPVTEGGRGGLSHLLYALQTYDLTGYDVTMVPKTSGHRDQRTRSFNTDEEWWFSKLQDGVLLRGHDWSAPIPKSALLDDYLLYANKMRIRCPSSATSLAKFLRRACPKGYPEVRRMQVEVRDGPAPPRMEAAPVYLFPSIERCREHWDAAFAGPYEWPDLDAPPLLRRQAAAPF